MQEISSTNGVYVNGVRIRSQALSHNDEVLLGPINIQIRIDNAANPSHLQGPPSASPGRETGLQTDQMPPVPTSGERCRDPHISALVSGFATSSPAEADPAGISGVLLPTALTADSPRQASALTSSSGVRPPDPSPLTNNLTSSSTFIPSQSLLDESSALAARPELWFTGPGFPRRRLLAGLLDLACTGLLVWIGLAVLALLALAGGATTTGLTNSMLDTLTTPQAWLALFHDLSKIWAHPQGGMWLAAGLVLMILLWVAGHGMLIISTVRHGAPWWHRRLGLLIRNAQDGMPCSWGQATVRWGVVILLPMVPLVSIWGQRRGLHDVWAGTRIEDRRRNQAVTPQSETP